MSGVRAFLLRRRGGSGWHWSDVAAWAWLGFGLVAILGPLLWLGLSSLKSPAALAAFPPRLLPWEAVRVEVAGQPRPLPLYRVETAAGPRDLAELRRVGRVAQMVDPADLAQVIRVDAAARAPVERLRPAFGNYAAILARPDFPRWLGNSLFVTVVATLLTLVVNSMAAFALAKYRFAGRGAVVAAILATLMIPLSVILVPLYAVVAGLGLTNSLWGAILPTIATPAGIFLLRQYMLTIPDELIEAARMDHASEWQIYRRIVLPLSAPALAVLAIFSVVWRWNDFLWPLVVLSRREVQTLQVGLHTFAGELNVQWHSILAMTVLTMIPVIAVFVLLQRHITAGIAGAGLR